MPATQDHPDPGHCQVCGAALSRVPVPFCPRCVAQQAALSLTELQESNWEATLARSFPHLKIHSALSGTWSQFAVERLEDGVKATLKISQSYEETEERHRQLRARSLLECPGILQLLEYGWLDGVLYTVMEARDGASLSDLLSEGKLSRTQLLRIREQLEEIESAASAAGYPLALRPEDVAISPDGLPRLGSLWRTSDAIDYTWLTKDDLSGSEIGRYKIVRLLGEGGFAEVYLAKKTRPMPRQVALKILKSGMDTRQIIGRFETERNLLALLGHPNIATVFDAGATSSGQPFFAMEYVDGMPLTAFAKHHRLPLDERLRLFVKLCQAVHHAHENGVVHRDLKPPNVLVSMVDGEPHLKVIDFGIAKVLGGPLGERTLYTELNQFVGSPGYMSPEQAELGALVDHRADIYALGAILFELLCDETPIPKERFIDLPHEAKVQLVRDSAPTPPTQRLNQHSLLTDHCQNLQTNPEHLYRQLRRGLGEIVNKALHRDPSERYATARKFGETVASFLDGQYRRQPFLAKLPSLVIWAPLTLLASTLVFGGLSRCGRLAEEAAQAVASSPPIDPVSLLRDPTMPPLIWIEPGTAMIGIGEDRRSVTFKHPFALGQFEVTQAEYRAIVGINAPSENNPTYETQPSHFQSADPYAPVESITWEEALQFCGWLQRTQKESPLQKRQLPPDYTFSLPTLEEWLFASQQVRPGGEDLASRAWYLDNSVVAYTEAIDPSGDGRMLGTQRVALKRPDDLGFHDFWGNVSEWLYDFAPDSTSPITSQYPDRPALSGFGQVIGGSWRTPRESFEETPLREISLGTREATVGFRLAVVHGESRGVQAPSDYAGGLNSRLNGIESIPLSSFERPVTLDFELFEDGEISPRHPLFQALGMEAIYVQSSDFTRRLDPRDISPKMLWSESQDQLSIVSKDITNLLADWVSYTIVFREFQQRVGFEMEGPVGLFEIALGVDDLISTRGIQRRDADRDGFYIYCAQPFNRLMLSRQVGRTSKGEVDPSAGFGIKSLTLDIPNDREESGNAERLIMGEDRAAFEFTNKPSPWAAVRFGDALQPDGTSAYQASAEPLGQRLMIPADDVSRPFGISLETNGRFAPLPGSSDSLEVENGSRTSVLISGAPCRLVSFSMLRPSELKGGSVEIHGENVGNVPVSLLWEDLPPTPSSGRNLTLRSSFPIRQITINSSSDRRFQINDLHLGQANPLEGQIISANLGPGAFVHQGERLTIESSELVRMAFGEARLVSPADYFSCRLGATLSAGCGSFPGQTSQGQPRTMVAHRRDGERVLVSADDPLLNQANRCVLWSDANSNDTRNLPIIPLRLHGDIPIGLSQSHVQADRSLSVVRFEDGSVRCRAVIAPRNRDEPSTYHFVVGLSDTGQTRDWDNARDPLTFHYDPQALGQDRDQPQFVIERTYACPLSTERGWAYVMLSERANGDGSTALQDFLDHDPGVTWDRIDQEIEGHFTIIKHAN